MLYDNFMRNKMKNLSKYKTATGYPCEFETKKEQELFDYRIYGNNGGVGDKTENLIDYNTLRDSHTSAGITYIRNKDVITANGTLTTALSTFPIYSNSVTGWDKVEPNKKYYVYLDNVVDDGIRRFYVLISIKNTVTSAVRYSGSAQKYFTLSDDEIITLIDLRIYAPTGELYSVENEKFKIMIKEDDGSSEYEPYGYKIPIKITNNIEEEVTTNIYLDEPLRKIDDYADYADYKNQKIVRNVREFVFAENPNVKSSCSEYTYGTDMDNTYHFLIRNMSCVNKCSIHSNILRAGNIVMNTNATDSFFTSYYSMAGQVCLQIEKALIDGLEGETNVDKLWNYLIENNAIIVYATTTVSEESVELPSITVPSGNVIMTTDTTIEPSKITVKYKK